MNRLSAVTRWIDATLDRVPLGGRQDPGEDVERQDAVDLLAAGVDGEGDAEIVELALGRLCPAPHLREAESVEPLADGGGVRCRLLRAAEDLAVETAGVIGSQQAGGYPRCVMARCCSCGRLRDDWTHVHRDLDVVITAAEDYPVDGADVPVVPAPCQRDVLVAHERSRWSGSRSTQPASGHHTEIQACEASLPMSFCWPGGGRVRR